MEHVKKVHAAGNTSYKESLKRASKSWKKGGGGGSKAAKAEASGSETAPARKRRKKKKKCTDCEEKEDHAESVPKKTAKEKHADDAQKSLQEHRLNQHVECEVCSTRGTCIACLLLRMRVYLLQRNRRALRRCTHKLAALALLWVLLRTMQ